MPSSSPVSQVIFLRVIWRKSHRSQITLSAERISYNIARQVKLTPDTFGSADSPGSDVWKMAPSEEKRLSTIT